MLKQILTTAALTTALVSGAAFAGGPDMPQAPECMHCFKPFIGLYYSYLDVDYRSLDSFLSSASLDTFGIASTRVTGTAPDSFNGIGFLWGAKYGPYFGMVMGMNHYFEDSSTYNFTYTDVTTSTTVTTGSVTANTVLDMYYADARGYLPLMEGFDLIGSIGAAVLESSTNFSIPVAGVTVTSINFSENRLAWRFGAGFDYYFTPNWGVEAMFHYMPTSGSNSIVEDFWTVDAGINYMFS